VFVLAQAIVVLVLAGLQTAKPSSPKDVTATT
jgi:hypothetical protein